MATLPGFLPSYLDSLSLCWPYLSVPVSLVAPPTISICPSESAFPVWPLTLSLTDSVSVPPPSLYMLSCVSLLLMSSAIFFVLVGFSFLSFHFSVTDFLFISQSFYIRISASD